MAQIFSHAGQYYRRTFSFTYCLSGLFTGDLCHLWNSRGLRVGLVAPGSVTATHEIVGIDPASHQSGQDLCDIV